ncbi:MAG: hypothetical protein K1X57_02085 [Gemmataceae bacterium]|nr:hypothetical protein [Gemmataceae bacterium]
MAMQTSVLAKLFGVDRVWHGPCTIVVDADVTIQVSGTDAIMNAGAKMYAPRLISGRVAADNVAYLPDDGTLTVVQWVRIRQAAGQDQFQQTVLVIDSEHIAAVEFTEGTNFAALGLPDPPVPTPGPGKK